jgi:hypothetical protein
MNNEILLLVITTLVFFVGYLMSTNQKQKTKILKYKIEIESRKVFLDRVFHLIELNESVNVKLYFDQALKELKIEQEEINL